MTDKRRLNVDSFLSGTGQTVTSNFADKYWTRLTDENYIRACEKYEEDPSLYPLGHPSQVSLYEFATFFDKNWKYRGTMKIVVPTPQVGNLNVSFFVDVLVSTVIFFPPFLVLLRPQTEQ